MTTVMVDVDRKVDNLDSMLREPMLKTEEYSLLLSRSVALVYAFEGKVVPIQHVISTQVE